MHVSLAWLLCVCRQRWQTQLWWSPECGGHPANTLTLPALASSQSSTTLRSHRPRWASSRVCYVIGDGELRQLVTLPNGSTRHRRVRCQQPHLRQLAATGRRRRSQWHARKRAGRTTSNTPHHSTQHHAGNCATPPRPSASALAAVAPPQQHHITTRATSTDTTCVRAHTHTHSSAHSATLVLKCTARHRAARCPTSSPARRAAPTQ